MDKIEAGLPPGWVISESGTIRIYRNCGGDVIKREKVLPLALELLAKAKKVELPFPAGLSQLDYDILEYTRQLQDKLALQQALEMKTATIKASEQEES